jgi:hypothetical protein
MSRTIIVLDNDETTGYYGHLMTYMSFVARCRLFHTAEQEAEIVETITRIAKMTGVFRPGTEAFLRSIADRKKLGIVSSVVMYTNALAVASAVWYTTTGVVDWPHFLARVLSCLAGDPSFFDVVLSRPPHLAHVSYPKKNFARVTESLAAVGRPVADDERIIFFDDKPGEILGASERFLAWHAPEYKSPLRLEQINAMFEELMPPVAEYRWSEYPPATIRREILAMSARSKDELIVCGAPEDAAGMWCGFDINVHLPVPVLPVLPVLPTLVITTEDDDVTVAADDDCDSDGDGEDTVAASEPPSPRPQRFRLHLKVTLDVSFRCNRRDGDKWRFIVSSWAPTLRCKRSLHRSRYNHQKRCN